MRLYLGDYVSGWRMYGVRIGRVWIGVSVTVEPWGGGE